MNRLTNAAGKAIAYSSNGNITSIAGIGTMEYTHSGKPCQVSLVTPTGGSVPAREQSLTYTSFQRPATLAENGYNATFTCNAAGNRVKMLLKQGTTDVLTRHYIGGQYEIDKESNIEWLYLGGDSYSAPAVYVKEGSSWKIYYICRDYLGSITHVLNADGSLKQELSYDAWGKLRNPATQVAYTLGTEPALFLGRGYTGHEHLPWFGLINMNARLYDAALGRFLSPDPYVQMPAFTQNFNRYSYCLNNPLLYTDPNGEKLWHWLMGDILTGGLLSSTVSITGFSTYGAMVPFTSQGYELQKLLSPIALKPNLHLGGDVAGIGFDVSVGLPKLSVVSYRYHYGQTYYSSYYDSAFSGKETRQGAELSVNGYLFGIPNGITYSGTKFSSGDISQTTNMITLGNPFANIQYENDFMFNFEMFGVPKADNGDRWRTAAVQINAGPFSLGTNMLTGDPGFNSEDRKRLDGQDIHKNKKVYSGEHANDYRFGSFYLGIGPIRLGTNNEKNRHIFQNRFAHDLLTGGESAHFQYMYNRPRRWYWYIGSGTGNTLW